MYQVWFSETNVTYEHASLQDALDCAGRYSADHKYTYVTRMADGRVMKTLKGF